MNVNSWAGSWSGRRTKQQANGLFQMDASWASQTLRACVASRGELNDLTSGGKFQNQRLRSPSPMIEALETWVRYREREKLKLATTTNAARSHRPVLQMGHSRDLVTDFL
jgi:hypothetical protein